MYVTFYSLAKVVAKDGAVVYDATTNGYTVKDPNGNFFSTDANGNVVDTLNRPLATKETTGAPCTSTGASYCYKFLDSQGAEERVKVHTGTVYVHTSFGQSGVTEYSGSFTAITQVELPDGTNYQFTYDSGTSAGHYGALTGITLPTGGAVSYTHSTYMDVAGNKNRWVTSRTAGGGTWNYYPFNVTCPTGSGYTQCQEVRLSRPSGDDVVYTFGLASGGAWDSITKVYNGSRATGTLLSTVQTEYTSYYGWFVRPIRTTTTLPNPSGNIIKKVEYDYDVPWGYGNVTQTREWKYYTGSPSSTPDRKTVITYKTDTAYLNKNIINKPTNVQIQDGSGNKQAETRFTYDYGTPTSETGVTHHDDTNYGSGFTTRGNVTKVERWLSGSTYLSTDMTYDTTGQVTQVQDAMSNSTNFGYSTTGFCSTDLAHAYPTAVTNALNQTTNSCYDFNTGLVTSVQDSNNQTTSFTYGVMNRLTQTDFPDTGQVSTAYNTTQSPVSIVKTTKLSDALNRVDTTELEGLGRVSQTQLSDPEGDDYVDTTYDTSGRVSTVSNPYRSSQNGVETSAYDGLSRAISVTHADNNTANTYYGQAVTTGVGGITSQLCSTGTYGIGFPVLSKDEAGKKRQTWTDGFGRTIEVDEPDANNSLTLQTCYSYDLLNNLAGVSQGSQTRSYTYDNLSRLIQVATPEAGTTYFSYTTVGGQKCAGSPNAVCRRTAPLQNQTNPAVQVTTTYAYDALNRLTGKTYSDTTPAASYYYDQTSYNGLTIANGKGRRTGMSDAAGSEAWSYDPMGRVAADRRTTGGTTGTTSFEYNLDGSQLSVTYPSGRKVKNGFSAAARLTSVNFDSFGGTSVNYNYLSGVLYDPSGQPHTVPLGNGLTETRTYSNRLQPSGISIASSVLTAMNVSYNFLDASSHNNGNVMSITDQLKAGRTQSFGYDKLNRLSTAQSQATSGEDCWNQTYTIDRYGNLTAATHTGCWSPDMTLAVSATTNRITTTGYAYDAAGNLTQDATGLTYQWDGESRLKSINSGSTGVYTYDGDGRRATKQVGSDTTKYFYSALDGQTLAELRGNDWSDYIYANGQRLARGDSYEDRIHIHGNNCSNCGWQYSDWPFVSGGSNLYAGYVIQTGDKLFFRQWQTPGTQGGMLLLFSDGSNSAWTTYDQDGYSMNSDPRPYGWYYRRVDLSQHAGKSVSQITVEADTNTAAGPWDIFYTDIALVSADGTVRPLYNRGKNTGLGGPWGSSGVTDRSSDVNHGDGVGTHPEVTTNYYHGDHLGSARLITGYEGYPVWRGTYLPFGYEWNAQATPNNYKFTGLERDSESGLDSTAFRPYNSTTYARWLSPDPLAGHITSPQSLNRYAYVGNNPVGYIDPSGLEYCAAGSAVYDGDGHLLGYDDSYCVSDSQYDDGSSYSGYVYVDPSTIGVSGSSSASDSSKPINTWDTGAFQAGYVRVPGALGPRGSGSGTPANNGTPCFGGDASCNSAGNVVRVHGNIESDDAANMAMAGVAYAVWDYSLGEGGSVLFGRASKGSPGLLNSNDWLRIGYGWKGSKEGGEQVFRLSGKIVDWLVPSGHIDLWKVK